MTGFGRANVDKDGWTISAEARSVNHRGLDIRVVAPPGLNNLELALRKSVKAACGRGRVECRISVEAPRGGLAQTDTLEIATELHGVLSELVTKLGLSPEIKLSDLFSAGFQLNNKAEAPDLQHLDEVILETARSALAELVASRKAEGQALVDDFLSRISSATELVGTIESLAAESQDIFRERLQKRLGEILESLGNVEVDETRLLQELAFLVDKADIVEEIVRAKAHCATLLQMFSSGNPEGEAIGKRVDFFLQELGREANTMAAKAGTTELTHEIVALKSEIERMREQANNLE